MWNSDFLISRKAHKRTKNTNPLEWAKWELTRFASITRDLSKVQIILSADVGSIRFWVTFASIGRDLSKKLWFFKALHILMSTWIVYVFIDLLHVQCFYRWLHFKSFAIICLFIFHTRFVFWCNLFCKQKLASICNNFFWVADQCCALQLVHFVNRDSLGLANDFLSLGFLPDGVDIQSVSEALRASFGDGTRESQDFQVFFFPSLRMLPTKLVLPFIHVSVMVELWRKAKTVQSSLSREKKIGSS